MRPLEDRYRRLLAWYPRSHRDHYEEEMLAVLLDDARPGQRRPRLAESVNLMASGIGRRIGVETLGLGDRRWRAAAAVVGVLMPIVLALKNLRPIGYSVAYELRLPGVHFGFTAQTGALAVAWTLTAVAALLALRRTAAVLAAVAVVTHAGFLAQTYLDYPVEVLNSAPHVIAGIAAVICLAVAEPPGRRFLRTRPGRAFGLAAALVIAWLIEYPGLGVAAVDGDVRTLHPLVPAPAFPYLTLPGSYPGLDDGIALALTAVAAVAAAVGVVRLEAGIRRRFLAILAPAPVLAWAISTYYAGYAYSSPQFDPPVLLVAGQWIGLAVIPLLTFATAVLVVNRRERTIELLALGRAAQRS